MVGLSLHELVGLLTHLVVFAIGAGAIAGLLPLARGRRSGFGLVLMALAMIVFTVQPRWPSDGLVAVGYVGIFAAALWLLIGPTRTGGKRSERYEY